MAYIVNAKACEKSVLSALLERRLLGMDDYLPPHTGARSRRQEARHFQTGEFRRLKVYMIRDVGKELPEDAELENLLDMDIPGLVTSGEQSIDFVEAEVREQLSHLSRQKQDTIVGIIGTYKPTVFETRVMPRLAPHRHWDLDIIVLKWRALALRLAVPIQWHLIICQS